LLQDAPFGGEKRVLIFFAFALGKLTAKHSFGKLRINSTFNVQPRQVGPEGSGFRKAQDFALLNVECGTPARRDVDLIDSSLRSE